MMNGKTENELNESTEKTAQTELNEKDLFAPDEMTDEMPVGAAVPGKKPAGAKKGVKSAKSSRQTKTNTKSVAKKVSEDGSKTKAVSIGKASAKKKPAKKKPAKKKNPAAKKLSAKMEKGSGSVETVAMPDDVRVITELPAAVATPRKAGRPKGSRNIVTVSATDIPAKRGRKAKTGSAPMPMDPEVVSTTPAKRGRKPKTVTVNVPVDAVVIAKVPAKRGRKLKIASAAIPVEAAAPVDEAPAPADEAITVKIPAKRGRKPKLASAGIPADATAPSGAITSIKRPVSGGLEGGSAGNIEALLQRMTACMEILSKTMEILVRDLKKES